MTPADDDLRIALAALAEHEPSAAQLAALRRRTAAAPRRRRAPRAALALCAATAVVALVLALRPAGEAPRSAPGTLASAAAAAVERPTPSVAEAPLRYARVRRSFRFRAREGGRAAEVIHEGVQESWVGARWRGRIITRDGTRRVTGDAALARRAFPGERSVFRARESAFAYGDGPLARLDPADLPAGRDAIARALTDGIRNDRWGPYPESRGTPTGEPEQLVREHTAYSAIILLVYARLTADQRAALLDVLANTSEAHDLGMVTDSAGRTGRGVALAFPSPSPALPANSYRIVFDPESAEILEWTMTPPGGPSTMTPEQHEVVLGTGWAQRVGQRP